VRPDVSLENGRVEVKFKPLAGKQDQAGGCRVALEGRRQLLRRARQCAREQRLALLHGERPPHHAQVCRCAGAGEGLAHAGGGVQRNAHPRSAGRQAYIELDDSHIQGAGAVGLWTKADSVTAFDDFSYVAQVIGALLTARSLRAFADGYVAVLLPVYLLALGFGTLEVGFLSTVTMLGSAAATLAVGRWGHRFELRRLLIAAAALMVATGAGFAAFSSLWPLLIVALAGTMNPGGGDVSVFYPLEHTALAAATPAETRTFAFARYSFIGSLFGAVGALASAAPEWVAQEHALTMLGALKLMFVLYGVIGFIVGLLYLRFPRTITREKAPAPLGPSKAPYGSSPACSASMRSPAGS
jgi:hypothetical protein